MCTSLDCVGILKLRNADVELRLGGAPACRYSPRIRLVFRTHLPRANGSFFTLQTMSAPILCTQPARAPEVLRKSLHSSLTTGGSELFLFGKNFFKGTRVIFQEDGTDGEMLWQAEAPIDKEFFHQNHMVVRVPPFRECSITTPILVSIIILSPAGQYRDHQGFVYMPCSGAEQSAEFVPKPSPKRKHAVMERMSQTGLQDDRTIPKDFSCEQHDHEGAANCDFLSPSWKAQQLRCYQRMKRNSVEANSLKPSNTVKTLDQPEYGHLPASPTCNCPESKLGLTFPVGCRNKRAQTKQEKKSALTPNILQTSQRSPHRVDCVTQVFERNEDFFPTQIPPLPSHTQVENAAMSDQTTEASSNIRLPAFNSVQIYDLSTLPNVPVPGHGFSEPTPHVSIVHNSPYSNSDFHFLNSHWNVTSVCSHPDPEQTFETAYYQRDVQSGLPENTCKEVLAPLYTQPPPGFGPAFRSTVYYETLPSAAERSDHQTTQHVERLHETAQIW
uniref:RHD domain-containing protein n=1 Tax=Eptatretus burgeri TaxID=7764 RepID=A0A8C4NA53_EPTBU